MRKLWLSVVVGCFVASWATQAWALFARGGFDSAGNGWAMAYEGAFWSVEDTATANGTWMKFTVDGWDNWSTQWGAGGEGGGVTPNGSAIGACYKNNSGWTPGNLEVATTSGKFYAIHMTGADGWNDRQYIVQELDKAPVGIKSVEDDAGTAGTGNVTVTVGLSGTPSLQEKVYVAYSVNDGAITRVAATGGSGATRTATIPGQSSGATVKYYVFTSAMDASLLTTNAVTSSKQDGSEDISTTQWWFCKLRADTNGGANYEYVSGQGHTYHLGNAWHVPAAAEPAGAYMRNPIHPYASSPVNIYSGNQAYGDGGNPGDQSGGTIYYRAAGATAWQTAAMEYDTAIENNKFWRGAIPADAFASGATVEYVIKVTYNDHDDTYLGLAAAGDVASTAFGTLEAAAAHPFDFTYAGEAGQEPAFVWHGGNAVKISGTNVQLWVKTGYVQGTNAWADQAQIRYKVVVPAQQSSTARQGVRAVPRKKGAKAVDPTLTKTVEMRMDHTDEDPSGLGKAMWWVGSVQEDDLAAAGAVLRYQIAVRKTTAGGGNGTWRLAEYQSEGANDTVFEYTMASSGANTLTVNGLNADYTTSKFFIDESKGETAHLHVVYTPPSGASDVQIFSNVGRRDYWGADLDDNGVPDAIRPPSGDLVTVANTATTNTYFGAWAMTWDADAGVYTWDADIGKTGAYRLTARYKKDGTWHYYSELGSGIRDHAIVISPRKVLEQNIYEVNGMTAKASAANEAGHSTFDDLIEGADGYAEFGVPYLNNIGANCLWFQPIHTSSEYGLAEGGEPGSPYAAKDYFSVSRWYGKAVNGQRTTAQALAEFQRFVAACDAGTSPGMRSNSVPSKVGTINIMLDGVFNHTSWDAVFGVMGERMGIVPAGTGASTAIASVKPGWYANVSDYGAPATWYNGPAGGQHDIASGPDRGDFGKWLDTAELFYGNYSALVRHNPDDNGNYLNEDDQYDYTSMTTNTEALWEYMGSYVPYWLDQTGHNFGNDRMGQTDENGTAYDDYGIDGLRCDFGQGLPPQFWEYCINRARAKKWNFMFMAESLDGGKVSYRSNRHFDILNESFVFAARNAGSPSDLLAVTDDKKAAYNGGAVLLNLTSHDEVMPYPDPWMTASRYAMLATVKGLPMTFYGQEQGIGPLEWGSDGYGEGAIVQPDAPWTGFTKFELNFGKWVADFKTWNKLTIWENPPMEDASREMAKLYGRINRAREGSPALQSDVQWMLPVKDSGGDRHGDIWAMAKAEEPGALANGKDAVLAFVLFVRDPHRAWNATFELPEGAVNLLGLEAGKTYTARNLAATDPTKILWTNTTEKLTGEGVWVDFTADQNGSAFYNDGAMVYFLKLEEYSATPDPETIPADDGAVDVPTEWLRIFWPDATVEELEDIVDATAANGKDTVWQCYIADLDPTYEDAAMAVGHEIDLSNGVSFKVYIPSGRTAEVCYRDDLTGATKENWQSFVPSAAYRNEGTADYEWTFEDRTWDGNTIRFYQLQMRMNQ